MSYTPIGTDKEATDYSIDRPLAEWAELGDLKGVRGRLYSGRYRDENLAMRIASDEGFEEIVEILLHHGVNPEYGIETTPKITGMLKSEKLNCKLLDAIIKGDLDEVSALINQGAVIYGYNRMECDLGPAVIIAVWHNRVHILSILLASFEVTAITKSKALREAVDRDNLIITEILLKTGAKGKQDALYNLITDKIVTGYSPQAKSEGMWDLLENYANEEEKRWIKTTRNL